MDLLKIAEENTPKKQIKFPFYYKLLSLLSVVRGFNVAVIVLAQYLAAIFIFSPDKSLRYVLLDVELYFIILASICVVAAGYIINDFYNVDRDRINKPIKRKLDSIVSQQTKLRIYFGFNFIGFFIGFLVSWRAAVFFGVYIFLIWLYAHKLKKYPLVKLFSASVLRLLPFFAVFVYYKNFSTIIFTHASFLFFVLMIRELVKDLENIQGDVVSNYMTLPIKYGEYFTKLLISQISLFVLPPVYFLVKYPEIGLMRYYFYISIAILFIVNVFLWKWSSKKEYLLLQTILKILMTLGVLSLLFVDTSVIVERLLK